MGVLLKIYLSCHDIKWIVCEFQRTLFLMNQEEREENSGHYN